MSAPRIVPADFDDPRVVGLLGLHLAGMHDASPPGTSYALDLSGLRRPEISLYTAWEGEDLLGVGALKALDARTGEIKSMRTHPDRLRRGAGRLVLEHIIAVARCRGYRRLSLETGLGGAFAPALSLYARYGFVDGELFGDYEANGFNRFLHLTL